MATDLLILRPHRNHLCRDIVFLEERRDRNLRVEKIAEKITDIPHQSL
jgi:hypothetical protein